MIVLPKILSVCRYKTVRPALFTKLGQNFLKCLRKSPPKSIGEAFEPICSKYKKATSSDLFAKTADGHVEYGNLARCPARFLYHSEVGLEIQSNL